jgi:hypothetical protein
MSRLDKNLALFEAKNPKAAALLSFASTKHIMPCTTEQGEPNLQTHLGHIYSQTGAYKEQKSWVESLNIKTNVLCLFGLGLGLAYSELKKWLKSDPQHKLIILEDDLGVLNYFLETDLAHDILSDPQVALYFLEDSPEGRELLKNIAWSIYPEQVTISCLPFYEKVRKEVFEEVKGAFLYEIAELYKILDEYAGFGIPFLRNFWKNIFLLPESYPASGLYGAFTGIPAIIVGAGPSLNTQFEQLGALRDQAIIFAGGSSTNALTQAGIRPHFGGGIDPNPTQYLRLRQGLGFELPFFYRHRILHEAISFVTGPKLYLKGGDGYNITDWIEKKLHIKGRVLGGGHGIANFLIEIAASLGCNPIILVGFDLAFTQGKPYAAGIQDDTSIPDGIIEVPDIHGKPIQTLWKWVAEANWISSFKKRRPKLKIINATQGGIGMKGVPHMSLQEAQKKYLNKHMDIDALVHKSVYALDPIACTEEQIVQASSAMYDSLVRVRDRLEEIVQELKTEEKMQNNPTLIMLIQTLQKEIGYRYVLQVFDRMRIKLSHLKNEFLLHPTHSEEQKLALENKQAIEHYTFLRDAAKVNVLLLARTMQIRASQDRTVAAFQPEASWNE